MKDGERPHPDVGTVPEPLDDLRLRPGNEDAHLQGEPRVGDVPCAEAGRVPRVEKEVWEDQELMGRELPEQRWVARSTQEAVLREVLGDHVLSDDLGALLVGDLEDLPRGPRTRRGPVSLAA